MFAFVGKTLVLVYGAVSLMCLIFAAMVFTEKMDFVTPKGEGGKKAANRVEKAQQTTKDLLAANNRAYTRWRQEYDQIAPLEIDQYQRREFYRGQLDLVRTGTYQGKKVDEPIQELAYDESGSYLKIDKPVGRTAVEVAPGTKKAVQTETYYRGKIQDAERVKAVFQVDKDGNPVYSDPEKKNPVLTGGLMKETQELIAKHHAATVAINGQEEPTYVKGLRVRIHEQEEIALDADAERAYLEDFVTNRRAEAQLFVKRRDSLQARVNELKKYLKDRNDPGQGN
jgi:hypothetical protein